MRWMRSGSRMRNSIHQECQRLRRKWRAARRNDVTQNQSCGKVAAMQTARFRSLVFLACVVVLSCFGYFVVLRHGLGGKVFGIPAVFYIMYAPTGAAIASTLITKRSWRNFGLRLPKAKYMLAGWLIPVAYATVTYVTVLIIGAGGVPNPKFVSAVSAQLHLQGKPDWLVVLCAFVAIATIATLFSCLSAAGEEIGWRGFWVPELTNWLGFKRAAIFSGIFWASWHVPIIVFGDYNAGTPRWFEVPCFAAMVISIAVLFAWIRLRSGSVWPCVLLHASHNAIIQAFYDNVTVNKAHTHWYTTEFGLGLVIPTVLIAIWCWRRPVAAIDNPSEAPDHLAFAAPSQR